MNDGLLPVVLRLVLLGGLFPALVSSQAGGCEYQFAPLDNITCERDGPPEQQGYCAGTRGGNGFWVSSNGPMASNAPDRFADEVVYFQRLFSDISMEARAVRQDNYFRPICPEKSGANENLSKVKRSWLRGALAHEARVGFVPSSSNCFTEIKMSPERSKEYWDRMVSFGNYMTRTGEIMLEKARPIEARMASYFNQTLSCWQSIHSSMSRAVETRAFICTLRHVAGFRDESGPIFNVGSALTNHPVNISLPEMARLYMTEKWSVDDGAAK